MPKRILFVEADDRALRELRRVLHPLRELWGMSFVDSAYEALNLLRSNEYDVIATDVGLPEMSGPELLAEVRKKHPRLVRVMLVAEADRAAALRAQGEAHQLIPKPCSQTVLATSVARACTLHGLLTDDKLVRLITKMEILPSVPSLYFEILEAMKDPNCTVASIGSILSHDIGMTAKVLQMVNSAFFGLSQDITDTGQAVAFLGLETIKALVLSLHTFSQFDQSHSKGASIKEVWTHSLRVADHARAILEQEGAPKRTIEEGFLAGMMHDAGKLVLACNAPTRLMAAESLAERDGSDPVDLERRLFGASHAAVGGYLLGQWGLPTSIVEAVAFHHRPSESNEKRVSPLLAVHVANCLSRLDLSQPVDNALVTRLDHAFLARVGRTDALSMWVDACRANASEVTS